MIILIQTNLIIRLFTTTTKKVKASHTRYRVLGPKQISVYSQSTRMSSTRR